MKNLITTTIAILLLFASCSDDSNDTPPSSDLILTELNDNAFKESSEGLVVYFENDLFIVATSKIQNCWKTYAPRAFITTHNKYEVIYDVTNSDGSQYAVMITGSADGITMRIDDGQNPIETYYLSPTDDCIV